MLTPRKHGFTLVEVALSLGLIAFSLMAVFSLLSVSLDEERAAKDDTAFAEMTRRVMDDLRSLSFTDATAKVDAGTPLYFNRDGALLDTKAEATYQCTISAVTGFPGAVSGEPNLLRVRLEFRWPVEAPAGSGNERIVQTTLARYE